ncbi:MAG: hypothetical protein K6G90_13920 [Clostridia bacterium]|nr:hypothetical protein [Clostridia bacterium]
MKPIVGVMPLWDDEKDSIWMLPGSEISMQSQVNPNISPIRREQQNAKFNASFIMSSSHNSIARNNVSASHISLFFWFGFGNSCIYTWVFTYEFPFYSLVESTSQ